MSARETIHDSLAMLAVRSIARARLASVRQGYRARLAPILAVGLLSAALAASTSPARADVIDDEVEQLARAPGYKRRLAAVLALSKSHEGRAVLALARALDQDPEAQIRRVAALALAKAVDETTPVAARDVAFGALDRAIARDRDSKVREIATRTLQKLEPLRTPAPSGDGPEVFVHVGDAGDLSSQTPRDTLVKLSKTVRQVVARRAPDVATEWPGKLPTSRQLAATGTRAFMVAATVSAVDITKDGGKATIACTVSVRIAPWNGTDGAEKWVAHKAASASGSGKAMTGSSPPQVAGGIRDCVLAVGEELTAKQVVPFLKRLLADG